MIVRPGQEQHAQWNAWQRGQDQARRAAHLHASPVLDDDQPCHQHRHEHGQRRGHGDRRAQRQQRHRDQRFTKAERRTNQRGEEDDEQDVNRDGLGHAARISSKWRAR